MSLSRICSLQSHLRMVSITSSTVLGSAPRHRHPVVNLRAVSSTSLVPDKQATASTAKPVQKQHDWNRAVSEAEKIVGYPTSFLSLRWLLSDEIANVALHLRKLVGSNHPLLKTAKYQQDPTPIILTGNFNLALMKPENLEYVRFVEKCFRLRLASEPTQATNIGGTCLDLTFCRNNQLESKRYFLPSLSHRPILILIYNGKNNMQAWGLIVLLISKAVGHAPSVPDLEQDKSAGVLHSQRALAEVTEMIRTSSLVHQGLVNLQPLANAGNELSGDSEMIFGNKIALLSGDYLLGNACLQLAGLKNQQLIELISSSVRDLAESNFVGDRDMQNNPLPSKPEPGINSSAGLSNDDDLGFGDLEDNTQPLNIKDVLGNPEREWSLRHILAAGSLLGKSCQGALILAGQPVKLQKQAYLFGKHLSLAWQACIDMEPFSSPNLSPGGRFSLISAPVLFHLEHDPTLYEEIKKGHESVDNIDYAKIYSEVINGPGLEKTRDLQKKHSFAAMAVLYELPPSDARTALQNIILAMQDL